jgi:Tfp pilus assembly protein PilO
MPIVDSMVMYVPESQNMLALVKLSYGIGFDSKNTIKSIIDTISNLEDLNDEMKLDISLGYLSLHESEKASNIFALIDTTGMIGQSLRYLSVKPDIFEANKKYSDAFQALKRYQITSEIENSRIYSQKTTVAEELHELMIEHLYSIQRKDRQLWFGVCILLVLIIVVGVVYYQLRLSKKNRIISEQKQSRLQLENENLQKQNFVLGLEKHNAELECERQHLAAENMKLRISQLESEGEHLKELLTEAKLSKPILASIQERIGILNGLLAAKISDNDVYSKPYDKWINQITEDRKSFMDSTRLAFRASHPAFMKYLDDHGLTESELNYVCLYAIGLRGKEIGEYIQLKRHYHMSTDIRKKLGLSEDDTNLGLHIRNLMKNL